MYIHESLFSSRSEEWPTPQDFYNALDQEFHFSLDPCATKKNAKCALFFTKDDDGLTRDWGTHRVFCNPPYGKTMQHWARKCFEASQRGATVVLLAHARTDTRWFHHWVYGKAAEIRFVKGRLKFGNGKQSAPFPSLVAIFKPNCSDRQVERPTPLDIHLNVAVMHMATVVCPAGFDVSAPAPATFPELMSFIERHRRIAVFSGGSEKTIYADREVNYCFRAWHDWCHWRGRFDFTLEGETAAWRMQCDHLCAIFGDTETTRRWQKLLHVEVVEQWLFHERHGYFPDDQLAFTRSYLEGHDAT